MKVNKEENSSAVSAVLKYYQFFIFAIPARYIAKPSKEVPFHGVGGKRNSGEDWINAIDREAKEETGANIKIENAAKTHYITSGAELTPIELSEYPRPYCIYKRTREIDPNFTRPEIAWLVAFEATLDIKCLDDLHPKAEIGALLCLTGDMLRRTLHERILYSDIKNSAHGDRIILGKNVSFDFNRRAVPSGIATIVAAEQRPSLFSRL